ncbi:MAG: pyruvate dehydrogenase E1, beta subunit [Chaenotheca gracillima]|nr:MAG: pyruvate dehydrogenase E1, beta subunit [Chaenotheca gracillima]
MSAPNPPSGQSTLPPFGAVPHSEALAGAIEQGAEKVAELAPTHGDRRDSSSSGFSKPGTGNNGSSDDEGHHITELARQITQQSIHTVNGALANPFEGSSDPRLDPHSGKFDPRAWAKTLLALESRDPDRYPKRVAGVSYRNLGVHGYGTPTDYQKTFGNYPLEAGSIFNRLSGRNKHKIQILRDFDGLVKSGEMLVVLGRPGSGCSTLLKTIAGETAGFYIDSSSDINYQGIPMKTMHRDFRGECIYQAEVDVHFPQLTVGQTLAFAAEARAPRNRIPGVSREQYAHHLRDVVMAVFGLGHTINTKVGNDMVRGVSGGERKRVSIAETAIGGSPLQCWDNSTRGLDSATALEFVKTLRMSTEMLGATAAVAIYQASQSIYDVFDKVAVLYEGRQIYFGEKDRAKEFFVNAGFHCPERATTGDFLTSLTNPAERIVRAGFENRVPRTPDEFATLWRESEDRQRLLAEIDTFEREFPVGGEQLANFKHSRKAQQAKHQRIKSPYTLSVPMQIRLCVKRGFLRLRGDMSITLSGLLGNCILALIVGSVFYNLQDNTESFYSRGALLFFAILLNAFSSALEILTLYTQRPIVEKQSKYAFYHPFAEAVASMICDLPNKFLTSVFFNLTLYFMTNLRRTPGHFFVFYLFSVVVVLTMSMLFRCIGALSRSLAQAMAPAATIILALVIYTGFVIPTPNMHPWFRWLNYIDPVAYAFESLMINEFHDRQFPCNVYVPQGGPYDSSSLTERACNTAGSTPGANFVDGDAYINASFEYYNSHLWRNLGILFALMFFFCGIYLVASEFISAKRSKGEVLLFRRGQLPDMKVHEDEEAAPPGRPITAPDPTTKEAMDTDSTEMAAIQRQTAIFHWEGVNYDIKIKGEGRRLLDDVDGWVKPGTLTALMGASGAGKTTLLDVLASRVTMGVVTGDMLVNGRQRDSGFQRKTGYVQQQDLHLATSTIREALTFSALLRQPKRIPRQEKLDYVDEVIKILDMEAYADAVVGVPGEGLNVEQRKRLTIGVELAAKPELLLFLDEPTSGLDSQTAWSICALLRKLALNGQAILCTIHQPSAILFQSFDRLLFLASGGRTVYYGDIGEDSKTLTDFFARNGSRPCGPGENPAEWMLDVIGAAPGSQNTIDWPQIWRDSPEKQQIKETLTEMKDALYRQETNPTDKEALREFAAPFTDQMFVVGKRVFAQYWRTPSYLYSKTLLCAASGLFIGFSFWREPVSQQGLQNQMFSVFMLMTIFGNLTQQIMPHFVTQRALYEVRERPSKTYSWKVFMFSNIIVELPWNTLMAVIIFFSWYYPIGMYRNAIPFNQVHERGALMFLFIWAFLLFTSTFTDMIVAGIETAETAGNISQMLFSLTLIFCGVLAGPSTLPGFWIFMYRVSPFTYLVDGMLSTGLANTQGQCSDIEFVNFDPSPNNTCGQYMDLYINGANGQPGAGGYLTNPDAMSQCQFCSLSDTNAFLNQVNSHYSDRWRNFGIMWVFIIFNVAGALFLYWLVRVPNKFKKSKKEKDE